MHYIDYFVFASRMIHFAGYIAAVLGISALATSLPPPGDSLVVSFDSDYSELGLTSFEFSELVINPDKIGLNNPDNVSVSFKITNVGQVDGDQVS